MIYRLRYCNKDGVEARVDIQKGSSTPVIEVEGTERPFILSYNNDKGNKSGMFLSSSADIEIYETSEFNINNLKTSNETELSVTHYINNIVSWQGFIIPDFFSIEVRSNPVITMTASDRLGTLKNVTLSDLPSTISLRELAILCLNKTGLALPLRTMADFNNGTGINDFFNSKILTQRLSDTKGRSISCYDILSSILTASNSFLVQRSGAWHIINKIQHEAGSGKLYTGATSFINWSDVVFNFSDISIGGRRTIIPVASTVGVFHEFGGGKLHPDNYDFAQGTAGWVASGGYSMNIEDREIKGYSKSGSNWVADFGQTTTKKRLKVQNLLNFPLTNLDTAPYAKATFPLITTNTSSVDISMDMSVMGMPWYRTGVVVLAEKGTTRLAFSQSSGKFEPYDPRLATNPGYPDFMINLFLPVQGSAEDKSYYDASTKSMKFSGKLEDSDLTGWNITIRLYGYYSLQLGSRVDFPMFFSFANVSFSNTNEIPKGNIYKTEKDGNFTKAHDIDTSIFADYITYGLNGFFYEYPIDDTSSLYNSANELTAKWVAYNDTEQLPLLQHITRQRSRLFSVAHDLLSAEIEVNNFDPLAIFVACGIRHTVVSAQFDFFKSNLSVELEEVAFQIATVRDFIYSYFGDGESGIKSIGGISGSTGGGGGTGGGLTPEQLEILSWWKKDPDNPDTIFTEMNAYSTKELSAYGVGDGGGGGGDGEILSFVTSGTGNAVTSIAKSGTVVTAYKDGSFLPLTGGTMANTDLVTNLNADLLDGLHGYQYRGELDLGRLIDYEQVVIALVNLDNSIIDRNEWAYGQMTNKRTNGSSWSGGVTNFAVQKKYNSTSMDGYLDTTSSGIQLCTFTYNGTKYGGIRYYPSGAVSYNNNFMYYRGAGTTPFMVKYRNNSGALNTEVDSSLVIEGADVSIQRLRTGSNIYAFTSDNVASATKLQTPRTIAGVSFDGTANIAIPFANLSNKPTTLGGYGITDAVTLNTAQTISGAKTFSSPVNIVSTTTPILKVSYDAYRHLEFTHGTIKNVSNQNNQLTIGSQNEAGTASIIFSTGTAATYAERMRINQLGNVGIGEPSPTQKLHVVGNILATGTTTTTKVIFNAAGWSMEQVGSELQMKHNNVLKMRFTSTGSIVATNEITAHG